MTAELAKDIILYRLNCDIFGIEISYVMFVQA